MALSLKHKNIVFGVGDTVKVIQKIKEGEKTRLQTFTGIVIKMKGRDENKSFTVRRLGIQRVGIERIFPLHSPTIQEIKVVRIGKSGVRRSKLYFIRKKHVREIENIYRRSSKKLHGVSKDQTKKNQVKSTREKLANGGK